VVVVGLTVVVIARGTQGPAVSVAAAADAIVTWLTESHLDIRIIDAATGELLRHLTLNPAATTSPSADTPDPTETTTTQPQIWVRAVRHVLRHHRRPRQDSNLRTRLRRPMLYPLSYEGGLGQVSRAASRLPLGRSGSHRQQ
jgi:hypothetical protein